MLKPTESESSHLNANKDENYKVFIGGLSASTTTSKFF